VSVGVALAVADAVAVAVGVNEGVGVAVGRAQATSADVHKTPTSVRSDHLALGVFAGLLFSTSSSLFAIRTWRDFTSNPPDLQSV
jgi:hypothetical protein